MDTVNAILPSTNGATDSTDLTTRSRLTQEEFYKIMVAELTNQDPLNPLDNQQFLDQLSSLQNLELTARLSEGIESLVFQQNLGTASSLIGKEVLAVNSQGQPMAVDSNGRAAPVKVDRVVVQGKSLLLHVVDANNVPLGQVSFESIREIR